MLLGIIGVRGTVPDAEQGTLSIIVDNHLLFDVSPEFVQAFERYRRNWKRASQDDVRLASKYGTPTFGRLEHIFLTHLHWDHFGGLRHLLHRSLLLEEELRSSERPLIIYIPQGCGTRFRTRIESYLGKSSSNLSESEIVEFMLCLDLGLDARRIFQIKIVTPGDVITLADNYQVDVGRSKHLKEGSLVFKITHSTAKLDIDRAHQLKIPFDRSLGILDREGSIKIGDKVVQREDVFSDRKYAIGYSGDSPVDPDLGNFYKDCNILVHETTYLERDDEYFLESHSALTEVIEYTKALNIDVLIPVHFSIRYNWKEIEETVYQADRANDSLKILLIRSGNFVELDEKTGLISELG